MEAGEREMRKAFEDVTTQNVRTTIDYSTETRRIVRDLGQAVQDLKNMVAAKDIELIELRRQLGVVQGQIYKGGTVNGG